MAHPLGNRTETAPMIAAVWGEQLSPVVAALIVARPQLGHRLALAPCRVLHVLAAYIAHALEQDVSTSCIAADVDTQDIRDLLGRAIPAPHPRFFGLLDRIGEHAQPLAFYRKLNQALSGPASALVLDSEMVSEACLRVVEALAAEPVLLAARKAIGPSDHNLKQLSSALAYLRATGLALDIEQLPHGAGWRSVTRRLSADLGRAVAPPLPFRCPSGWRPVETLSDLFRLGRELQNCVAGIGGGGTDHLISFVSGTEIFLTSDSEPTALASLQNVGPRLWVIAETAFRRHHPGRLPLIGGLRIALGEVLAEAGHVLLEIAPVSALQSIAWQAKFNVAQGEDADDDDIDVAA